MIVTAGMSVSIADHDYANDSRTDCTVTKVTDGVATIAPRTPWKSQGRKFGTMAVTLSNLEWFGAVGYLYHTPPAHTGKSRRVIKSFAFAN